MSLNQHTLTSVTGFAEEGEAVGRSLGASAAFPPSPPTETSPRGGHPHPDKTLGEATSQPPAQTPQFPRQPPLQGVAPSLPRLGWRVLPAEGFPAGFPAAGPLQLGTPGLFGLGVLKLEKGSGFQTEVWSFSAYLLVFCFCCFVLFSLAYGMLASLNVKSVG